MPDRLIISAGSSTAQLNQMIFEMGRPGGNRAETVVNVTATAQGTAGSATTQAPGDHRHGAQMATTILPVSVTTSTAGVAETFSRGDHVHFASPGAISYGGVGQAVNWSTSTAGVSASVSREDHVHRLVPGVRNTPSRTTNTLYTNLGTGPIWVCISAALSELTTSGLNLEVGGASIAHADGASDVHLFLMGIINTSEQYRLTATANVNIAHWIEYAF